MVGQTERSRRWPGHKLAAASVGVGALLLLLAGFVGVATAAPPGPTLELSTGLLVDYAQVAVSGDWAAWPSRHGLISQISVCDLRSNTIVQVGSSSTENERPQVSDGLVVWQGRDEQGTQIYLYETNSGDVSQLTSGPGHSVNPLIGGRRVVWLSQKDGSVSLILYDLLTHASRVIVQGGTDLYSFATDGSYVVWQQGEDVGAEIFLYDVVNGGISQVTNNDYADFDPKVKDGYVAWRAYPPDGGQDDVFVYTIDSGQSTRLTHDEFEKYYLTVDGGHVAWMAYTRKSSEIYVWDAATGLTKRVTRDPYMKTNPQLEDDWLTWEWGSGSMPDEIFLYHLPSGITLRVTDDRLTDSFPRQSQGHLLWTRTGQNDGNTLMLCTFPSDEAPQPDPEPFPDISSSPYRDAIRAMSAAGAVQGFGDGLFHPEATLNRAQLVKMLVLLLHIPVSESMTSPFWDLGTDDPSSLYPNDYVAAAYQVGIVQGVTARSFVPWGPVSRAQLVTMIVRAADARHIPFASWLPPEFQPTLGNFDPTHARNMSRAELDGILSGLVDFGPLWDPWAPATRGEASSMLWNLLADWTM